MASAVIGALRVALDLGVGAWTKGLRDAEGQAQSAAKRMQAIGGSMIKTGAVLTASVTAPMIAFGAASMKAAAESRDALGQVEQTLKSMGNGAGFSSEQLQKMGKDLMYLSTFDDDEILRKVTANMLTFGNVAGEQFARAQRAAVDLATRMGGDLQAATLMVGKALNDPAKGLAALRRVGIQFTAQQQDQIKAMAAAGDAAGAQSLMLAELERQFGGAGKAARDAVPGSDAINKWADLQESIGGFLLDAVAMIEPYVNRALDAFNNLDPSMQKIVVIGGALVGALGPLLLILGPMVSALGAVIGAVGAWASGMSLAAGLAGGWGALLAPILPVIAGIAAAVGAAYLVWKNWDTIGPILAGFWESIKATIGPPLMNLIAAVKDALTALWTGPFGQLLQAVGTKWAEFQGIMLQSLGSAIPGVLEAFGSLITGVFNMAAEALRFIVALLSGDFAGAWEHAKGFVSAFVTGVGGIISGLGQAVVGYISSMVQGIDNWMGGALSRIWSKVKEGIESVKSFFYGLYDAVVGNSYIPDMVDGIGAHMRRLDSIMVEPAKKATAKVAQAMKDLAAEVKPILDRLFPDEAQMNAFLADAAVLDRALKQGLLSASDYAAAMDRLKAEQGKGAADRAAQDASDVQSIMDSLFPEEAEIRAKAEDMALLKKALDEGRLSLEDFNRAVSALNADPERTDQFNAMMDSLFPDRQRAADRALGISLLDEALREGAITADEYREAMRRLLEQTAMEAEDKTAAIITSFAEMAQGVVSSLRSMVASFKSGDILGGIQGVLGLLGQVANVVAGISGRGNPFQALSAFGGGGGGFGGGRALGGPVVAGKTYRVGERGPEWFTPATGGRITPDGGGGGGMVIHFNGVLTNDQFWQEIDRRDGEAATKGAVGGAQIAAERSQKRGMRRLR